MTPTDLGITSKVLIDSVTGMFTTMAPFLLIVIPVVATTIAVKWGLSKVTGASKGKGV